MPRMPAEWSIEMLYTKNEVLQFVQENDVKFIRMAFCDIFGRMKNISVVAEELPRVFQNGISFDASAIDGFMNVEESDLFLHPDPSSLAILPWRPQHGRVVRFFCDIKHPNGLPFEGDCRTLLCGAVHRAKQMGYECRIGPECEFYLFETDDMGIPTKRPHDTAGYLDIAPDDKGENVRREICLTLEEMGIRPESSHHEQGPGQNEIDFKYSDALAAADNLVTFKSVVRTIAAQNGLHASFMPKPIAEESGNGLHINLSLAKEGKNIFKSGGAEADCFIAGVLERISEITVFLNPITNSYRRFGSFEAPRYITWSHQNRSQLIRIPAAGEEESRMELRSADPYCNPYIAFALLIHAGLDGIQNNSPLCSPANFDLFAADKGILDNINALPRDLEAALEEAENSKFVQRIIPKKTLHNYLAATQKQWKEYRAAKDKEAFEYRNFF